MVRRNGMAIGIAVGVLLGSLFFNYILAFEPGGFSAEARAGIGAAMIGATIGGILGWVLSRPRPSVEDVLGVPATRRSSSRGVMWAATVMGIVFAVGAGLGGSLVAAFGWLALALAYTLFASGAAARARGVLYLSVVVFLLGLLSLGTALFLGEF